jgi:NAD(P)-dependent dehydrogenase (short-subunit alcohol dehydrogenase family)
MNVYDLKDRVAIVTGGAQGIGLAVATRILASGGKVSIWDRDTELLNKTVAGLNEPARVQGSPSILPTSPRSRPAPNRRSLISASSTF